MFICTMKREFSTIFMLSVLVFGLILNPSVFPDSTVDSNPISNNIFKSAFAQLMIPQLMIPQLMIPQLMKM